MMKRSRLFKKRVPNVAFGTLLLLSACGLIASASATYLLDIPSDQHVSLALARNYYLESDWKACRVEAMRTLKESPDEQFAALLRALSESQMDMPNGKRRLEELAQGDPSSPVVSTAQYELGLLLANSGDLAHAYALLATVFQKSTSRELYLRAGCTLGSIISRDPELAEQSPGLIIQLQTSSVLWNTKLRHECFVRPKKKSSGLTSRPLQWIVALYRRQISPAIGIRCSCYPSCSEFGVQCFRRFGIFGLAIYGARAIREPDIIAEEREVLYINGRRLCCDPVDNYLWKNN